MRSKTPMGHVFVDSMPDVLENGVLYISFEYGTAIHLCCCGCGNEVVTPLAPHRWRFVFDGSISLYPSIGNWSFPCQSHYWIRNGEVVWSHSWSEDKIRKIREDDAKQTGVSLLRLERDLFEDKPDWTELDPQSESKPKKGKKLFRRK